MLLRARTTPALMIQGTGSHVGKSVLVAGLCRALANRGLHVRPYKPQNMSNNAAVAADGGEIGRAQATQARAARVPPSIHMNPVLLKPETDTGAQVVVQGHRRGTMRATEYGRRKAEFLPRLLESFSIVGEGAEIVVVEGAGSPAEVNLRQGDIANMGFAEAANVPVVLIGDVDRGGVIASLVGTQAVLPPEDRARIRGFVVNKLRGDAGLFAGAASYVEEKTGWPCLGIVPWFDDARRLPAEDVLGLADGDARGRSAGERRSNTIAVPVLRRIANFDDLDPLRLEPGVRLLLVQPGEAIPGDADLVLIPGTKSTVADLAFLREQGWDIDIAAHRRRGGRVLGLCGGYQMLGRSIADPDGVEGSRGTVAGLGLLDIHTVLGGDKTTDAVAGRDSVTGASFDGYEIHLGRTSGSDCVRPMVDINGRSDGARSPDGLVAGTYIHGIFASDEFRHTYLAGLGGTPSAASYEATLETTLDGLAAHLEAHLDIDRLLAIAGLDPDRQPDDHERREQDRVGAEVDP